MIERERVAILNDRPVRDGRYVLYWMQASQRVRCNYALIHAASLSNDLGSPLVVFFGLTGSYPEANLRHYSFMLEGMREVALELERKGVRFVLRLCHPPDGALELSREAAAVVCDRGYLRHQREWRADLARRARCRVVQVETDAVVPVDIAYQKEAYSAAVLRRRLHLDFDRFLNVQKAVWPKVDADRVEIVGEDPKDTGRLLRRLDPDRSVRQYEGFKGGPSEAEDRLKRFIGGVIDDYADLRSDPSRDVQSNLSPYIHFGQISPIYIAKKAMDIRSAGAEAFIEELVVRRELALNFVDRNPRYDSFECLPDWARSTLMKHASDVRPRTYSLSELESAETHDPYWNAAQTEIVRTGKMHGYMRMYWGKKVIEWTDDPREAYARLLYLNNKYELDGRDPNSYAGIAWCFGKHDRPWGERAVFGSVRYMNDKGLERKFDLEGYIKRVSRM